MKKLVLAAVLITNFLSAAIIDKDYILRNESQRSRQENNSYRWIELNSMKMTVHNGDNPIWISEVDGRAIWLSDDSFDYDTMKGVLVIAISEISNYENMEMDSGYDIERDYDGKNNRFIYVITARFDKIDPNINVKIVVYPKAKIAYASVKYLG